MIRSIRRAVPLVLLSTVVLGACSSEKAEEQTSGGTEQAAAPEAPAPEAQKVEISRGEILAANCFACHGPDGKSEGAIPAIDPSQLNAEGIENRLKDFRDGKKESTMMIRHAKGYTDEEIKLIAEAIAAKK